MASLINADTSGGLKLTSDTSGVLSFQTAGVTRAGVNSTGLTGDGSQLTGIASGGLTLLSTLTTTSGTEVTTGTLDLSTYKTVIVFLNSVGNSHGSATPQLQWKNNGGTYSALTNNIATIDAAYGFLHLDLATGVHHITRSEANVPGQTVATNRLGGAAVMGINNGFTTSTTAILFSWTGGETFNAGTIKIYGLK